MVLVCGTPCVYQHRLLSHRAGVTSKVLNHVVTSLSTPCHSLVIPLPPSCVFQVSGKEASSSKQPSSSKEQARMKWEYVEFCCRGLDCVAILEDDSYAYTQCEQETQTVMVGTVAASGGSRFQNLSNMAEKYAMLGCPGCLWRGLFALGPTSMMKKHIGAPSSSLCTRLAAARTCYSKMARIGLGADHLCLLSEVSPSFAMLEPCWGGRGRPQGLGQITPTWAQRGLVLGLPAPVITANNDRSEQVCQLPPTLLTAPRNPAPGPLFFPCIPGAEAALSVIIYIHGFSNTAGRWVLGD